MPLPALSLAQVALVNLPADRHVFVEGVAGTGKTTAGVARLLRLLADGVPADSVLVLTPQRTLAAPFTDAVRGPAAPGRQA
jgi:DNA helicase-2/ATP-dependent DNA helicase PcrA